MPHRRLIFSDNQFYHIYNRTIASEVIFQNNRDLSRALSLIKYYRYETSLSFSRYLQLSDKEKKQLFLQPFLPRVDIHAFCFMPNHFHLLLRQLKNKGIQETVSYFQNGMAKYINVRKKRNGSLFCHPFKAKHIESEEQLLHISRYIHLNPVVSNSIRVEDLIFSPYTSFKHYHDKRSYPFVRTDLIINKKRSYVKYQKFVFDQADYQKKLSKIKLLMCESQGFKAI
ncbi:MAG: transposase [Patescibacteria group bacterium]